MSLPQLAIEFDGFVDGLARVESVPVRQDVGGDEIDRRCKLRMFDPHRPDFAGRDRHRTLPFDALNKPDEFVDRLLRAQRGFVTDHYSIDVAVGGRKGDGGLYFPLVAGFVLIDPDAEGDFEPELRGDRRHELTAAGRAVGADRLSIRTEDLQIGANLFRRRAVAIVRMLRSRVGRIGDTGERGFNIGSRLLPLAEEPSARL